MTLGSGPKKSRVTTNRGMIKKTFLSKGVGYASELALQNCKDLLKILEWNEKNNIRVFRMSSDIFPWMSEYDLKTMPRAKVIKEALFAAGDYARRHGHRLTFHPGPYVIPASDKENVRIKSIKELEQHSQIMDMLGYEPSRENVINIHMSTSIGGKNEVAKRFIDSFGLMSESLKARLTLEVDDRPTMWSAEEIYELVHKETGIPIVFDIHHWECHPGELSMNDAAKLCAGTWGKTKPLFHKSSSRRVEQKDPKVKITAHSDYILEKIDLGGLEKEVDIDLEAKCKELAVVRYRKQFC